MALIEYEAGWAPEPLWMFWRQEKSLAFHPHFKFNPSFDVILTVHRH